MLDRLRNLRRDREQQVDLGGRELARLAGAQVERALELVAARDDGDGQDRLVLVLAKVGEGLEARVEVGLRRDHHRRELGRRPACDALAWPHAGPPGHLLDTGAVGGAQHELAGTVVVEVDEARIGVERVGDPAGHQLEHLLEVERRVDGRNRLGKQAQMPL